MFFLCCGYLETTLRPHLHTKWHCLPYLFCYVYCKALEPTKNERLKSSLQHHLYPQNGEAVTHFHLCLFKFLVFLCSESTCVIGCSTTIMHFHFMFQQPFQLMLVVLSSNTQFIEIWSCLIYFCYVHFQSSYCIPE